MNYDDLLPAEQNNPVLVQNLQQRFALQPTDTQVIDHVHEQLTHFSGTLPVSSPQTHATGGRVLYLPSHAASTHSGKKIGRKGFQLSAIAAVIIVGLLVSSLAFTFSAIHNRHNNSTLTGSGGPSEAHLSVAIDLIPDPTHPAPTQQALQVTRNILYQRLVDDGFKGVAVKLQTVHNKPQFEVDFATDNEVQGHIVSVSKSTTDEEQDQTFPTLINQGILEFWGTGQQTVALGSSFDPQKYTRYNPNGLPQFTGGDLDAHSLAVTQDPQTSQFVINGKFQKDATNRFQAYTAHNIGNVLTITVDRKVIVSAVIEGVVKGPLQITGNFAQSQAKALVSIFKYGPLPITFSKLPAYPYQLRTTPSTHK